jgi:hypothetical protein
MAARDCRRPRCALRGPPRARSIARMTDLRRHRTIAWTVLLVAGAGAAFGLANAWTRPADVDAAGNPAAAALLAFGTASPPLLLLGAARVRRAPPAPGAVLRWSFVAAVLIWFVHATAAGAYCRAMVGCTAAAWSAAVALLVWRLPAAPRRPRRVSLLLLAIALALLGGELALRAAAWLCPNPLLTRRTATASQRLAAHRFAPHQQHFGVPTNALGFYDGEFAPPSPARRPTVAVIGDSFSASFVPLSCHYTTVAERALEGVDPKGVDIWNVGWPALGPAEYRALLEEFVLPLQPDAVIVSLFLGNDLAETVGWTGFDRALADWFDRGNVLLCEVPRRLLAAYRGVERDRPGAFLYGDLAAAQAWLHDPTREPGTFAPAEFLRLEVERARIFGDLQPRRWDAFAAELLALRDAARPHPFAFALIPDECMVEDALWARVQAQSGAPLARHALRERLIEWCRQQAIPCLDLWPALTAVPPLADGDRHLYLLRDTHWNARGNEVGGRALAPIVAQLLARRR